MSERDLAALAAQLREFYGDDGLNPPDGREDEFGDLLLEAFDQLGGGEPEGEVWEQFLDVAIASSATTYEGFLAELAAVVR